MHALFLSFLAILAVAASAEEAVKDMADVIAPPAVLRLADAYVTPLPEQEKSGRERDILRSYIRKFFKGFVDPDSSMIGGNSAGREGFQAGRRYRRSNPEKLTETMEGFGYTATNGQGTWSVSFEHSGFRADSHPGRDWWLLPLGGTGQSIGLPPGISAASVRISGFLSPKGRYGHRGMYEREFFATNIVILDISQPEDVAKRSQPVRAETNKTSSAAGLRR